MTKKYINFSFQKDVKYFNDQTDKATNISDGSLFACTHDLAHLREVNARFSKSIRDRTACQVMHESLVSDLFLSNVGSWTWNFRNQIDGPVQIDEIYYGDSTLTCPRILPALIFHVTFWNHQLNIMLVSNKSAIDAEFIDSYANLVESNFKKFSS